MNSLNCYMNCEELHSYREPSGLFYLDVTTFRHLSGLSHLDNFIVTRKSCPLTGTVPARLTPVGRAKTHANPDPSLALWAGSDGT